MGKTTFQRPVNHFSTTLASGHTSGDGQLVLQSGDGAILGALGANQVYRITAVTSPGLTETINKVFEATGITTDTLTGVTAVEGFSDGNLSSGQVMQVRATAKTFSDIQAAVNNLEAITEVSVTGAVTLDATAYGKWHVCSGTSADYTVVLPACSGHAGDVIGFRMSPALTKLVTLDGNASEAIDGATTRIMWASETALLYTDGSNWFKLSGHHIPMSTLLTRTTDQTGISASTWTALIATAQSYGPSQMYDSGNGRISIVRPGIYQASAFVYLNGTGVFGIVYVSVGVNSASAFAGYQSPYINVNSCVGSHSVPVNVAAGDYVVASTYYTGASAALFLGAGVPSISVVEVPSW